jgi:hypothetical protein
MTFNRGHADHVELVLFAQQGRRGFLLVVLPLYKRFVRGLLHCAEMSLIQGVPTSIHLMVAVSRSSTNYMKASRLTDSSAILEGSTRCIARGGVEVRRYGELFEESIPWVCTGTIESCRSH